MIDNNTMDKITNGANILINNIYGYECNYTYDPELDYITFYKPECFNCPNYEKLITNNEYVRHPEMLKC